MSETPAPPAVPLHKMSVFEQLLLARKYSHEVAFIEKAVEALLAVKPDPDQVPKPKKAKSKRD